MSVPCAVLMCHAPIVIPAIAGPRGVHCVRTTAAMDEAARQLLAYEPDVIVIISPHAPRDRKRFGIVAEESLYGDFRRFGVPELAWRVPGAPLAAAKLRELARARELETWTAHGRELDHGTLVPLHFLCEAGWRGATLVLALPFPNTGSELAMGAAIADCARALRQRFCVLASGDMSHRLSADAPAGYHPGAHEFDASFCELIAAGKLEHAVRIDARLRTIAAEDVVDSCAVAAAAVDFSARGGRVLCYEGPFGVGYLEAVLHAHDVSRRAAREARSEAPPQALLTIARGAIASHLQGTDYGVPALPAGWTTSRAVFVTLRNGDGALRGCIGHLEPAHETLGEEVAACAVAAANRDVRFAPLRDDELEQLQIEISVLSEPEPVSGLGELDPARYGVVVSSGEQRGVLLPGIDGVRSARDQVRIAATKAGLHADAAVSLQRFSVIKLAEPRLPERGAHRELN